MINKKKKNYHSKKNTLFDISNLANQFDKSNLIYLKSSEYSKIHFLEN